jgi:hypothetical protein
VRDLVSRDHLVELVAADVQQPGDAFDVDHIIVGARNVVGVRNIVGARDARCRGCRNRRLSCVTCEHRCERLRELT